ncbi:MAG TPA: hypothetical protein VMX97_06375 [Hyphomicrobiaceae bacterium]|nr:hypothetical protein [Hyphomicrobiaceae bacterium]
MFRWFQKDGSADAIGARLETQLTALDRHVAEHGAFMPRPLLGLRIGVAFIVLFAALGCGYAAGQPMLLSLIWLVALPFVFVPEIAFWLLHRRYLAVEQQRRLCAQIGKSNARLAAALRAENRSSRA